MAKPDFLSLSLLRFRRCRFARAGRKAGIRPFDTGKGSGNCLLGHRVTYLRL
jgi:hypothetical protein